MRLLETICKELGVKIERGWLGSDNKVYQIEKDGSLWSYKYDTLLEMDDIKRVLTGELKPVWSPKIGESYYIPLPNDILLYGRREYNTEEHSQRHLTRGLAFKTKEEAIAAANKMIATLRGHE